jgi:oligopeptidase B
VPVAPVPAARTRRIESPHGSREDPYFWLRDDTRSNAEVLAHLAAETAYADAVLTPARGLMEELYVELIARLKQDDASVPVRFRGKWYQSRYIPGLQYAVIVWWPDQSDDSIPAADGMTVLLDSNALASGHPYFHLGTYEVSRDNRLLAYTEDVVGRRQYRLRVRDLTTGALLTDTIDNIESSVAWAADSRTLIYLEKDPVTLLGRRVRAHTIGAPTSSDVLLYEEADEAFDLTISTSKSDEYLFIAVESTTTSEWRFASAREPHGPYRVFLPREVDHEYQIEHRPGPERSGDSAGTFIVRTNWQAQNFRLMSVPVATTNDRTTWCDVVPHDAAVYVDDYEVFRDFLAIGERSGGLRRIRVQPWDGAATYLEAQDPAYSMWLGTNPDLDATRLRYVYSSLTTPATTYHHEVATGERTLLKREPVLGDFDPNDYASEFIWIDARDGERVPVSLVYRKDTPRDGSAPLYLYAYGSYGLSTDPVFSASRLSLLARGFICALAHIRGGQELGRRWYEAGRLEHKWNTFRDFIDVTDALVARGYGARDRVFAVGGSAGGLLVGAVMNEAPEKYAGIVAHVPFVDVVTTMLDESIPLTTLEYDEWGDPNEAKYYRYMLSYSPYDNVRAQAYPALLATTGLWDSQVQYYEPAKWVARLRAMRTDPHPALLHVNLEAGHGGKSGRFERLREVAREYAFVIRLATDGRGAWDQQ